MSYYQQHLFFCTNQKTNGNKCCQEAEADKVRQYAKLKVAETPELKDKDIRVNASGCLGRCMAGPSLVIYPEGVWYTYQTEADIDEIISEYLAKGELVERLLMPKRATDG